MVTKAEKWCKHHNATLMEYGTYGFSYMLNNGTMWYMPYDEIEMQKGD